MPEPIALLSEVMPRMMPASQPLPALLNAHTLQKGLRKSRSASAGRLNLGVPLSGLQPDGSPRRSPRAAHAGAAHAGAAERSGEQSGEQLLQVWAQLEGAEESDFVHNHRQSVGVKAHAAIVAELRGDRDRDRDRDRGGRERGSSAAASPHEQSSTSLAELRGEAALKSEASLRSGAPGSDPSAPALQRRSSVVEREAVAWRHENRRWIDLVGRSHAHRGDTGPTLPSPPTAEAMELLVAALTLDPDVRPPSLP